MKNSKKTKRCGDLPLPAPALAFALVWRRRTEGQKLCQVMASHVTRKPIAEQYYVMPKYPKNVGLSSRLQHPKFTLKIQGCAKSLE